MARMYGAHAQRCYEDRQWRRDWEGDIDDAWWERYDLETYRLMTRRWCDDPLAYLEAHYDYLPRVGAPVT